MRNRLSPFTFLVQAHTRSTARKTIQSTHAAVQTARSGISQPPPEPIRAHRNRRNWHAGHTRRVSSPQRIMLGAFLVASSCAAVRLHESPGAIRRGPPLRSTIVVALIALLVAGCQSTGSGTNSAGLSVPVLAQAEARAQSDPRYAGIVIDVRTGRALYSHDADQRRYPASLAKMMTLYILFEEIEAGRLSRNQALPVSRNAARQPPSKFGVRAGSTIKVRNAIRAIAVRSANDVAVVVAEAIAGTEDAFARRMTQKAAELGMRNTVFRNASGLPNSGMVTTARDMGILARAIMARFPRESRVFATESFSYDGRRYTSTNRLLGQVRGVDGIKTGYTRASGYNLAASVRRRGTHLIVIVMGERSGSARNGHVAALMDEYLPGGVLAFR